MLFTPCESKLNSEFISLQLQLYQNKYIKFSNWQLWQIYWTLYDDRKNLLLAIWDRHLWKYVDKSESWFNIWSRRIVRSIPIEPCLQGILWITESYSFTQIWFGLIWFGLIWLCPEVWHKSNGYNWQENNENSWPYSKQMWASWTSDYDAVCNGERSPELTKHSQPLVWELMTRCWHDNLLKSWLMFIYCLFLFWDKQWNSHIWRFSRCIQGFWKQSMIEFPP